MTAPKKAAAPATTTKTAAAPTATKQSTDATPELRPGNVVFYDAAVHGQTDPAVFVGLVIHSAAGRVRVKPLGLASDSADFPAGDVRLSA